MTEGGFDTASYVYTVATAGSHYGTPDYWIRYFSPSPNGTVNQSSSHANAELDSVWDTAAKHLSPISYPAQSRLSGTSAEGLADAQTFVSAIHNVWLWVLPLNMPANRLLYCWLDEEKSSTLSTSYWTGWSGYINAYQWGDGTHPLYAALYCDPCGSGAGHNCTTVATAHGCYGIWSNEPEFSSYCSYKVSSPPAWNANTCTCATGAPSTILWQYAEQPFCGLSPNVDLDAGTLAAYSLYLVSKP